MDFKEIIDVDDHQQNLNKQIQEIRQHCSTYGIGGKKYLFKLYTCFKKHIEEFSEEIYINLLEQKSKAGKLKNNILEAGQHFLTIYEQSMSSYDFGL